MNPIFQLLLQDKYKSATRQFLIWYNTKYPNSLAMFQNLPFTMQIGVFLEYFETIYNLVVMVNTKGYAINFTDNRNIPLVNENNFSYNHYKYEYHEPKSIIYGYQLGILWLFENYDLPF